MHSIDDFIGVFPNALPPELCELMMEKLDHAQDAGLTLGRFEPQKKDQQLFLFEIPAHQSIPMKAYQQFNEHLQACYLTYADKYSSALSEASGAHTIYQIKLQKTEPSQGYHVWHYEQSERNVGSRLLVWTAYLNTIEEGGETEFLYQSRRVKPEQGTICIFPASFTHTHRGNPPLSGSKYIATGWYEF